MHVFTYIFCNHNEAEHRELHIWPVHLSAVVSVLLTYKDLVVEQSGRTTGGWEEQSDNIYEIANPPMKLKFELWMCFSFAMLCTKKEER